MIKFAIVGFGNIGKRHALHIQQNAEAELVAVCDIDHSKQSEIEALSVTFYDNYESMLADKSVDVICICTPNYLHKEQTIAALASGFHTVTEKPMAISEAECQSMITAEKVSGKTIFAVKQNRYNPPVQAVKELMEKDALGELFMIQVNCFWNRNDAYYSQSDWRGKKAKDGGCLYTQFSHFIDILYYLVGDIEPLSGYIHNYTHPDIEIEDSGMFQMRSQNGAMINFNYSTATFEQNMEGAILLMGTKGTVKIGGQYLNTIAFQHIQDIIIPDIQIENKDNNYGTYKGSMSNHDKVIENVIAVLNGKEKIMTSSTDGLKVVTIIDRMYQVAKNF